MALDCEVNLAIVIKTVSSKLDCLFNYYLFRQTKLFQLSILCSFLEKRYCSIEQKSLLWISNALFSDC